MAIVLINLGTPDDATVPAVRRYLREFLMDPYVIDIPTIPRWMLVNLIIAPFRAKRSAKAYQKIWHKDGSPLLLHTSELCQKLDNQLEEQRIHMAMRYGSPSIDSVLSTLKDETELIIVPLYPQFAHATTQTVLDEVLNALNKHNYEGKTYWVPPFFDDPRYIEMLTKIQPIDVNSHLLISFHGLPIRQLPCVTKEQYLCKGKADHCPGPQEQFPNCYRAHCYETARNIAKQLDLSTEQWSISFQSWLGKIPWIEPYTDDKLEELVQSGVTKIQVICPAFATDCLETLEEINIELRELFFELGGEEFTYIPCLNADDVWVESIEKIILETKIPLSRTSLASK